MKNISNWIHEISLGWVTLAVLLFFLIFMATVLPDQAAKAEETSAGAGSPDTSFIYSVEDLYEMADAYGEQGRQAYIQARIRFDILFPLVYTAFLCTSISWLTRRTFPPHSRWQYANLVPLFGMLFDLFENTATSVVMGRYPAQTPVIDWLAPVFTLVKWVFVNGSFVLLFVAIIIAVWRWVNQRNLKNTPSP